MTKKGEYLPFADLKRQIVYHLAAAIAFCQMTDTDYG